MKTQGEIKKISTVKKGVKVELFIETEDMDILGKISRFYNYPITFEILVDKDKVVENFDTITDEQRKKIYALVKDFAKEYGESDVEVMKSELKGWFVESVGIPKFSLSTVNKDIASSFIEYIIMMGKENGFSFAFRESQDDEGLKMDIVNQICSGCGKPGEVKQNKSNKKICLCDDCFDDFKENGKSFLEKHHIKLIEL